MYERILRWFIKDYENTEDSAVRGRYATFAGVIGIASNFFCLL